MVLIENKNMQKNRFIKNSKKSKIKFGDSALCCLNDGRIELIHVSLIKKKIKKFVKKKKNELDLIREKIWYFGRFNFYLQKKSKNSRMGKGKGLIERKVMRVRKNFVLLEFKGVQPFRIKKLIIFLNKICSVKFYILKKREIKFNLWCNKNRYITYFNKYLY